MIVDVKWRSVDFLLKCAHNIRMEDKREPGRPPVGEKAQNARLYVRAVDSEKELLEDAARQAGMTLSDWIRDRLTKAARRELKRYT